MKTRELYDELTALIETPNTGCYESPDLQNALDEIPIIETDISIIFNTMTCAPINNAWNTVVETGLCTQIMGGIYPMWVMTYLTLGLIFALNIIADNLRKKWTEHKDNMKELESSQGYGDVGVAVPGDVEMKGNGYGQNIGMEFVKIVDNPIAKKH